MFRSQVCLFLLFLEQLTQAWMTPACFAINKWTEGPSRAIWSRPGVGAGSPGPGSGTHTNPHPPSATAGAAPPLPGPFSRLGVPGSQSSPALILPPVRAGDRPEAFRETHLSRAFCLRRARAVCPQPESLKSWVWAAQRRIKSICVSLVEALRELQVAKKAAGGRSASAPATQE